MGLAMHRKYSHPQGLLHSAGRGDKSSPRRFWPQKAFSTQLFGGLKPEVPLLWERGKKRVHSHCHPERQKRMKYYGFFFYQLCASFV